MTSTKNTTKKEKNTTTRTKKTTKTSTSEFGSINTNNIAQTAPLDTQSTSAALSDMGLINLKKVESDETEIIYESNMSKQSSFFKDLWYSLKGYFSSTQ